MEPTHGQEGDFWSQHPFAPIPDPTVLTSRAVEAAKADLRRERELIRDGLRYRTEAIDRDLAGLHQVIAQAVAHMEEKLAALRDLTTERLLRVDERFNVMLEHFAAVDALFHERDVRHLQKADDSERAIRAAFAAAHEAVAQQNTVFQQMTSKSEVAVMKQLDQMMGLLQNNTAALESKIGDLKERLTLLEGRNAGFGSSWGILVSIIGIVIAGLVLAFNIHKP